MEDNGAKRAVATLVGTDVSVADHDELAEASRAVARLQSFADLAKVQIARRTRELADTGDTNATHVLVEEGRLSGRDAKNADERDRVCGQLPEFEAALADGRCTAGHLDAVANHTKDLTDAERADLADVVHDLVSDAADQPVGVFDKTARGIVDKIRAMHRPDSAEAELERQRRASKVKRWTDKATGMKHTLLALDPIRDASVWNAVDHHLRRLRQDPANTSRSFAELQVEAFVAATSAGEVAERIPEIILVTDTATMCHGLHPDTLCETIDGEPIPPATAQRLCCEALVTAVVGNPDGTVDQVCEEQRTANRKQRRILAAMYSTCAHPHCQIAFSQCRIHHVQWFSRGGKTVLANLVPLCETHHHLVHEGGWNLLIDERRRLTWQRPDGTTWHTDDGPDRTARNGRSGRATTHGRPGAAGPVPTSPPPPDGDDGPRVAEPSGQQVAAESSEPTAEAPRRRTSARRGTRPEPSSRSSHRARVAESTRRRSPPSDPSVTEGRASRPPEPATWRSPDRRRTTSMSEPDDAEPAPPSLF